MARQRWLGSEPGLLSGLRQAAELGRCGLRRPWLALLLSALLAASVVGVVVVFKRGYAPVFMLRVVEADRDPNSMPRLKRQLAEYARQAVMTSEPLLRIMRKHGLYASLLRKNARAALQSFREDISIEVYQNYFLEDRAPGDLPRSARLAVSYRAKDPVVALAVTRDLGALIVSHEQRVRREQALLAAQEAERERDALQRALQQRSGQIVRRQTELAGLGQLDTRAQVELIGMLGSVSVIEQQLEAAERRGAALELAAALERGGVGLYFEVVDEGALPGRAGQLEAALLVFVAVFACGLPLVALSIGAFSSERGQS
jgi:hypothetical protein